MTDLRWTFQSALEPEIKQMVALFALTAHGQRAQIVLATSEGDQMTRLDSHILFSSLFVTSIPVSLVQYEIQDDVYDSENPPRRDTVDTVDDRIENKTGVTVLDVMRSITDWGDPSDLVLGEKLCFIGLQWDPMEYALGWTGHPEFWKPEVCAELLRALCAYSRELKADTPSFGR